MRRFVLIATLVALPLGPVCAQTFTPLSGPNTPVPSPVCELINFGFCPQPPAPPPPLPDPNAPPVEAMAARRVAEVPPPRAPHHPRARVLRRTHPAAE